MSAGVVAIDMPRCLSDRDVAEMFLEVHRVATRYLRAVPAIESTSLLESFRSLPRDEIVEVIKEADTRDVETVAGKIVGHILSHHFEGNKPAAIEICLPPLILNAKKSAHCAFAFLQAMEEHTHMGHAYGYFDLCFRKKFYLSSNKVRLFRNTLEDSILDDLYSRKSFMEKHFLSNFLPDASDELISCIADPVKKEQTIATHREQSAIDSVIITFALLSVIFAMCIVYEAKRMEHKA